MDKLPPQLLDRVGEGAIKCVLLSQTTDNEGHWLAALVSQLANIKGRGITSTLGTSYLITRVLSEQVVTCY